MFSSQHTTLLARGTHLALRTLCENDEPSVLRIYRENPRFFRSIAGVDEPPIEYIKSDALEGPPGFESHKHFLGLASIQQNELLGVADFVLHFPEPNAGCFGLLLLSERFHHQGLGREAATLVERWAFEQGVRRVTLGIELANETARQFWRRQGYTPTGEQFTTTVLGRTNEAEALEKILAPEAP